MHKKSVALRERGRLAAFLHHVWHAARQQWGWREPDRRKVRTWQALRLAVVIARTTRLLALGQVILAGGGRAAQTTKAVAVGLGRWLVQARFAARPVSTQLLEAGVRRLDVARLATSRGQGVVAVDPTEDPKRSRGRSTRRRHMQHAGRVRKRAKGTPVATGARGAGAHPDHQRLRGRVGGAHA